MTQETLEEAAAKHAESTPDNDPVRILSFINGAIWQAERMYSEKEVLIIIQEFLSFMSVGDVVDEEKWLTLFKKQTP
jgi:hypothetical protein